MNRTDEQVEADVRDELFWDRQVDEREIAVEVHDGVVKLRGTVGSFAQKRAAKSAAWRVVGVAEVENELQVRLLDVHSRADAELRGQVLQVLDWNALVPRSVDATVYDAVVTLRGTAGEKFERDEAEVAVRNLYGVRDVINEIELDRGPAPGEVKDDIEKAFRRNARIDADEIRVDSAGGTVTLRGSVRSWAEHDAALDAAWAAPGVQSVDDRLTVAY